MHRDPLSLTLSILRNTLAFLVVGVFSKAMGLVIAVLIARFLGPEAMGLFALLFGIALFVENTAPLGLQDVLIRDAAAKPLERIALWKEATQVAISASLVPSCAFLVAAYFYRDNEPVLYSLITLAIGMPISALALVSQAILQGLEKVFFLTWATLLTRIASLILLGIMLYRGAGVEAAFVSRVLFQASSAALFVCVIFIDRPAGGRSAHARSALNRALPFAFNRALIELTTRAPLLLLPIMFSLKQIGLFDAADRIRLTLGIAISVATTAFMPAFSRSFFGQEANRGALVGYSVKYVCLAISVAAAILSIFADPIIRVLYGPAFSGSAILLQVLVWAQMLVATDAILKQAIVASGRESAVARRAVVGLILLTMLVVALGSLYGLQGAAVAVLLAAAAMVTLDLRFVVKEVVAFDLQKFVLWPLLCGLLVGSVLLLLDGVTTGNRLMAGVSMFLISAVAMRLVPKDEREFLKATFAQGLGKMFAARPGSN